MFCQGPLLASVQNASIFSDSKEFVDRPLLDSPATILAAFSNLSDPTNITVLRDFVDRWTSDAGSDLEIWDPPDWVPRYGHTLVEDYLAKQFQYFCAELSIPSTSIYVYCHSDHSLWMV